MIGEDTKQFLSVIAEAINREIDILIPLRENCKGSKNFYTYRYVIKKLEIALGACNRALDKIEEQEK